MDITFGRKLILVPIISLKACTRTRMKREVEKSILF